LQSVDNRLQNFFRRPTQSPSSANDVGVATGFSGDNVIETVDSLAAAVAVAAVVVRVTVKKTKGGIVHNVVVFGFCVVEETRVVVGMGLTFKATAGKTIPSTINCILPSSNATDADAAAEADRNITVTSILPQFTSIVRMSARAKMPPSTNDFKVASLIVSKLAA
jgi:hypothetical protein